MHKWNVKWNIPLKEKVTIFIVSIIALILIIMTILTNSNGDTPVNPDLDYDYGYEDNQTPAEEESFQYDNPISDLNQEEEIYYDDLDN